MATSSGPRDGISWHLGAEMAILSGLGAISSLGTLKLAQTDIPQTPTGRDPARKRPRGKAEGAGAIALMPERAGYRPGIVLKPRPTATITVAAVQVSEEERAQFGKHYIGVQEGGNSPRLARLALRRPNAHCCEQRVGARISCKP